MTVTREAERVAPAVDVRRGFGDVLAAAALGWALWTLAGTDGGADLLILRRAAWPLLLAAPVAAIELRRLPRRASWVAGWYGVAAVAAVGLGGVRAGFVQPAIVYALLPIGALLAMRLWRRPWGPAAVGGLLAVVLAVTWWGGLLAWAGSLLDPDAFETWRSLSWHNQSAILTGALGLVATGVAVTAARRAAAAAAVAAAGAAFAATWLTGSRGGLVAVLAGALVVAAATRFRGAWRWVAVGAAACLGVALLTSFGGGEPVGQAIGNKGLTAGDSVTARVDHMAAAVAMFGERPLLGHGLGSYGRVSSGYAAGDSNPSYHAHSELLEPFAEGGAAFGLAMTAALAGVGLAALRVLRRGIAPGRSPRPGLVAGSVGALAALVAHAAVDFDWMFPLLALLAAVTAGIVLAEDGPSPGPALARLGLLPVGVLLAVGLAGASVALAGSPPWSAQAAAGEIRDLLAGHDADGARQQAQEARRWNPGDQLLRTLETAAAHESGDVPAVDLLATLDAGRPSLTAHNVAAQSLIRSGDVAAAGEVLATVTDLYRERPGWALDGSIDETWRLTVVVAASESGCAGARNAIAALRSDALTRRITDPAYSEASAPFCRRANPPIEK